MFEYSTLDQRLYTDGCTPPVIILNLGSYPEESDIPLVWDIKNYSYDGYPADVWWQYDHEVITSAMIVDWP